MRQPPEKSMKLTVDDISTITAYIKSSRPEYKGPVVIGLSRLEELHMDNAYITTQLVIKHIAKTSRMF